MRHEDNICNGLSCKISMLDETVTVIYFMFLRRYNWFIYAIKTLFPVKSKSGLPRF